MLGHRSQEVNQRMEPCTEQCQHRNLTYHLWGQDHKIIGCFHLIILVPNIAMDPYRCLSWMIIWISDHLLDLILGPLPNSDKSLDLLEPPPILTYIFSTPFLHFFATFYRSKSSNKSSTFHTNYHFFSTKKIRFLRYFARKGT